MKKGEEEIMKGKIIFLWCLLVMAIALTVMVKKAPEERELDSGVRGQESVSRSQVDQKILRDALESPENFQTLEKSEEISAEPVVQEERPKLLSEVERPARERVQKEPVAAESLYFWKDYESLRKDEIRNPDSTENREGVVALMKARQRRVTQEQ